MQLFDPPADKKSLLEDEALDAAAEWHALFCSGEADEDDESAFNLWLSESDLNYWAWGQLEQLQKRFERVPAPLMQNTFSSVDRRFRQHRRHLLIKAAFVLAAAPMGWMAHRNGLLDGVVADYHTATGEIETLNLADGTRVMLNTASALDVRFYDNERRVILKRGEILIQTSENKQDKRPFIVETEFGTVRALGTRFSVRTSSDRSLVSVYEHSVAVTNDQGVTQICSEGYSISFNQQTLSSPISGTVSDAWKQQMLIADNMPLSLFLTEISRYRGGIVDFDPVLAEYRISGAFKTTDTDQALRAVEKAFPVRVNYRTRFWVTVSPEKK